MQGNDASQWLKSPNGLRRYNILFRRDRLVLVATTLFWGLSIQVSGTPMDGLADADIPG
jgi:hypothetical protein